MGLLYFALLHYIYDKSFKHDIFLWRNGPISGLILQVMRCDTLGGEVGFWPNHLEDGISAFTTLEHRVTQVYPTDSVAQGFGSATYRPHDNCEHLMLYSHDILFQLLTHVVTTREVNFPAAFGTMDYLVEIKRDQLDVTCFIISFFKAQ